MTSFIFNWHRLCVENSKLGKLKAPAPPFDMDAFLKSLIFRVQVALDSFSERRRNSVSGSEAYAHERHSRRMDRDLLMAGN